MWVREDRAWAYPGFGNSLAVRRLRVWRVGPGRLVAVVQERYADGGTSVTNAAEAIAARLAAESPDDVVEVVEHWYPGEPDEHFDAVHVDAQGRTVWRRMSTAAVVAWLGPEVLDREVPDPS
jgi:hypothetical protein